MRVSGIKAPTAVNASPDVSERQDLFGGSVAYYYYSKNVLLYKWTFCISSPNLLGFVRDTLLVEDHIYLLSYPHHVEGHQDG